MAELRPDSASQRPVMLQGRVATNRFLAGASWWLEVDLPEAGPAPAPGQFYMLRGATWGQLLARPFSIAGVAEGGRRLAFLVDRVGRGTAELVELAAGDGVVLWGPLGNALPRRQGAVMVAGGVGLAPFLHALDAMEGVLLFGGRGAEQVATTDLVPAGTPVHLATDDGSRGHRGTVVDLLADLLDRGRIDPAAPFYVCGPDPMMAAAAALAADRGLACLVSLETAMGCGLGICSGCAVKVHPEALKGAHQSTVLACKAGPIFPAAAIDWPALLER